MVLPTKRIDFSLSAPQAEFLSLECTYPAFVAGYGSGKSYCMSVAAFLGASSSADAVIGIYEPVHDLIRTVAWPMICARLDEHGIRYTPNKNDGVILTSNSQFGDFLFRSYTETTNIVGYETYQAHVDELDKLPMVKSAEAWNAIIGRCRQIPKGVDNPVNSVSAYSTPEGYKFMYHMWKESQNPRYQCVHAASYSNPKANMAYLDALASTYSPQQMKAYILGQFVNFESATVYEDYNRKNNRSVEVIKPDDVLHIGADFNVKKTVGIVFVKRDNGWHAVREFTGVQNSEALARKVALALGDHKIIWYPDASGDAASNASSARSAIDLLRPVGAINAPKKNGRVEDRFNACNKGFRDGVLWVNDVACHELSRCLEQQAFDKHGKPDKDNGQDHAVDAFGYFVVRTMPVRRPMFEVPIYFPTRV